MHIGYFDTQPEAARAYDQEAIRLRGPNTALNYPISDYDVSHPRSDGQGLHIQRTPQASAEGTKHTVPYCSKPVQYQHAQQRTLCCTDVCITADAQPGALTRATLSPLPQLLGARPQ